MERRIRLGLVGLTGLAAVTLAGAQEPIGPEVQANSIAGRTADSVGVQAGPGGSFVAAWRSTEPTSVVGLPGNRIEARRFDASGLPLGPEFQVNAYTTMPPAAIRPSVLVESDGSFLVVWDEFENIWGIGEFRGQARLYGGDGSPEAVPFEVAADAGYSAELGIDVAARPSGEFIVVWGSDPDIEGRRFDSSGTLVDSFTILPDSASAFIRRPSVEVAPDGEFVVVWEHVLWGGYPLPATKDIRLQRFDAAGDPVGSVVDVTGPGAEGSRYSPRVRRGTGGEFLVVWQDYVSSGTDTDFSSIQARAFDSTGAALGPQFQVNDRTSGYQAFPRVGASPDGGFLVVWNDDEVNGGGDGDGAAVLARHLGHDGAPLSSSFLANAVTTGSQNSPDVTILDNGDFIVAWDGPDLSGQSQAVFVRRFRPALFADGFESGGAGRWVSGGD